MVCGTFTMRNVPQADLQDTIAMFEANQPPPNSVTSAPDGNGAFTVTAVFPPCPANLEHSAES